MQNRQIGLLHMIRQLHQAGLLNNPNMNPLKFDPPTFINPPGEMQPPPILPGQQDLKVLPNNEFAPYYARQPSMQNSERNMPEYIPQRNTRFDIQELKSPNAQERFNEPWKTLYFV